MQYLISLFYFCCDAVANSWEFFTLLPLFGMTRNFPGQVNNESTTPRDCLLSHDNVVRIPGGGLLDATYCIDGANTNKTDEIRAGTIMAQITASKLWAPCKRTTVDSGFSGSGSGNTGTILNVVDARHFSTDDTLTVEGTSAGTVTGVTISAIDYDNNTITVGTALDNPAVGSAVYADTAAGLEIPRAILNEFVDLQENRKGETSTKEKYVSELIVGGLVDNDKILGDLAAIRGLTLGSTSYLNGILWGDQQGT